MDVKLKKIIYRFPVAFISFVVCALAVTFYSFFRLYTITKFLHSATTSLHLSAYAKHEVILQNAIHLIPEIVGLVASVLVLWGGVILYVIYFKTKMAYFDSKLKAKKQKPPFNSLLKPAALAADEMVLQEAQSQIDTGYQDSAYTQLPESKQASYRDGKLERMKNDFVSIVSHELRTPLTSIRGALGLLANKHVFELPHKAKELVDIASTNSERLIQLINDILDIEKIEAGKAVTSIQPVNLVEVISEVIASVKVPAQHQTLPAIVMQCIGAEKFIVLGDRERLQQVGLHLLSNALRYSATDQKILVTIEKKLQNIRVSFIDQGPGISTEFAEKIFGKFMQADSSSTRSKGGSGLGLNISKAIIEKHNGLISFFNNKEVGSTFYFDLPAYSDQPKFVNHQFDNSVPNILSVEDDIDVTRVLAMILQNKANVWNANSLESARRLLATNQFDLIVLDIYLPDGVGTELLPCLNKVTQQAIPVIVFSVDDLPDKYRHLVNHTLLKSKATNMQLYHAIEAAIN